MDVLCEMKPAFRRGLGIRVGSNGPLFALIAGKKPSLVRQLNAQEVFVLNRMNGRRTIQALAIELAQVFEMEEDEAFAQARALFIDLAKRMICQPSAPCE